MIKLEKRNKYLVIIILVLVILVGLSTYFVYQNYMMYQMDKYMIQTNVLAPQISAGTDEANNILNSSTPDYNAGINVITETISLENQTILDDEQAYQYANGPYKDLINLSITKDRLNLNLLTSWRNRIYDIQQGNIAPVSKLLGEEKTLTTDWIIANDNYQNFLSTHLDVKEHTIKYWNSTDD